MTMLLGVIGAVLVLGAGLPPFFAWRLRHHGLSTVGEITGFSRTPDGWRVKFQFATADGSLVRSDFGIQPFTKVFYAPGQKLAVTYDPAFAFNHTRSTGLKLVAAAALATVFLALTGGAMLFLAIGTATGWVAL